MKTRKLRNLFTAVLLTVLLLSCNKEEVEPVNPVVGVWSWEYMRDYNTNWSLNPNIDLVTITEDYIGGAWQTNYSKTGEYIFLNDQKVNYHIEGCYMYWYFADGSAIKFKKVE